MKAVGTFVVVVFPSVRPLYSFSFRPRSILFHSKQTNILIQLEIMYLAIVVGTIILGTDQNQPTKKKQKKTKKAKKSRQMKTTTHTYTSKQQKNAKILATLMDHFHRYRWRHADSNFFFSFFLFFIIQSVRNRIVQRFLFWLYYNDNHNNNNTTGYRPEKKEKVRSILPCFVCCIE